MNVSVASAVAEQPPDWFVRAVAVEASVATTDVEGARINYRQWGEPGLPGLVLVHGGAANARWWDHVAPLLARGRHVVAPDLSGHGESGHRANYQRAQWAREVHAVIAASGMAARPTVVGHSLGGFVTLAVAAAHGSELTGIVVVDSPLRSQSPEHELVQRIRGAAPADRTYPSLDQAIARFRPLALTRPNGSGFAPWITDYLGRHSVLAVDGGYRWQFDRGIFFADGMVPDEVSPPACRVALIRAGRGPLTDEMARALVERTGARTRQITVPDSGHHVMLDQPLALAVAIDALSGQWQENQEDHQ